MPRRPRVVPSSNIGPVSTDECVIRFTGIGVDRIPPLQGPNLKDSTDIGAFGRGGPSPGEPVLPAVPGGFTLDDFVIDHDEQAVTCPAGHTRPITPTRTVTLGKLCTGCPLRAKCTTAKTGRSMTIHQHEGLLRAARAQGRTPEFKQAYPTRSNVETDRRPRRHPERAPDQAAPPGCRGEQRLAAYPSRRVEPAHPAQTRPHPPRRGLGLGLSGLSQARPATRRPVLTPIQPHGTLNTGEEGELVVHPARDRTPPLDGLLRGPPRRHPTMTVNQTLGSPAAS